MYFNVKMVVFERVCVEKYLCIKGLYIKHVKMGIKKNNRI